MAMEVTTRVAASILSKTVAASIPTLLVGSPGIGKSDIGEQVADKLNCLYITSHPVIEDETDQNGMPSVNKKEGYAEWLPFEEKYNLLNATEDTLWHIEDIGQARPAMQASYMKTLLNRTIGNKKLPDCVKIMASTNGRTDRAGVGGMLEPVKGRFEILHVKPDLNSWVEDFALPQGIHHAIVSCLRLRPEIFARFEPTADITNSPTPRGWARVNALMDIGLAAGEQVPAFAGAVGEGAAVEYTGHLRIYQELPSFDEIVLDPAGAPVPESPAANYAIAGAVAHGATRENVGRVLQYLQRLEPEFGVLGVRDSVRRNRNLINTPEWTAFTATDLGKLCIGED